MSHRIFISYRRTDQAGFAGRLFDRIDDDPELKGAAFMDVEGITPGHDYESVLKQRLSDCDVILAVIGDRWLSVTDATGRPRLEQEDDIVRRELVEAFSTGKRVIPILIDSTPHLAPNQLPDPLRPLANCQSLLLTHRHFDLEAGRIIDAVKAALQLAESSRATQKKRSWDRATFLQSATETSGEATAEKLTTVMDWAERQPFGFRWGSGQKYGSFMLVSQRTGQPLFYGYVKGDCNLYLDNLEKACILPGIQAREAALGKLNTIPGIFIPLDRAGDQYPAFQIAHVEPANVPKLLGVLEEILLPDTGAA